MDQCDVVIVGGGVAGSAMGVALGRYGLNTVMLERRKTVGEINRGDALQLSAVRALDRLGVLPRFLEAGAQKTHSVVFSHFRKGRLGEMHIPDLFDPPFNYILTLPHEKIETVLIEEAKRRGVAIRRGNAVNEMVREGERTRLSISGEEGDYDLDAKLVIGADGKFSTVRKHVVEEPDAYWYDQECVVVEAENPDGVPGDIRMAYHPDGLMVIGRLAPTVARIYIFSLRHDAARIFKLPTEEIGKLAVGPDPLLAGYGFRKSGGHVFKLGLYHCRRYVTDGFALIGDAAHITGPAGGHGMNLAINDAEALAETIGPKLAAGEAVRLEDLQSYEAERRQTNEAALAQAHGAFMRLTGPQWGYRMVRTLFFWVISNLRRVRKRMAKPMLSLGTSPSKR